jgi:hypothetical protein
MSALHFQCPATGRQVATGIEIDSASYSSLSKVVTQVSCPHCREPHILSDVSAWLADGDEYGRASSGLVFGLAGFGRYTHRPLVRTEGTAMLETNV